MAGIKGIEGMSDGQLSAAIEAGGRFVVYHYVFSVLILTFRRRSDVYFIRYGQDRIGPGLPYSLISLAAGWWGVPWGFIFTPIAVFKNFAGGTDVTAELVGALRRRYGAAAQGEQTA